MGKIIEAEQRIQTAKRERVKELRINGLDLTNAGLEKLIATIITAFPEV